MNCEEILINDDRHRKMKCISGEKNNIEIDNAKELKSWKI